MLVLPSHILTGSIPWMITGEVFDHASRPAAISIAVFVNWTGNFAVGIIFPIMQVSKFVVRHVFNVYILIRYQNPT